MAPTGSATSPGSDQADDIGFQLIVVAACFLVLVLILVGLRIVAQITTRRKPGMDDYFLLIGILCLIALDGITMGKYCVRTLHQSDLVVPKAAFLYNAILYSLILG